MCAIKTRAIEKTGLSSPVERPKGDHLSAVCAWKEIVEEDLEQERHLKAAS